MSKSSGEEIDYELWRNFTKRRERTNKILEAIGGLSREINDLRQETRQQIGDLRREMNECFTRIETEIVEIKEFQFSFDVRLERVQELSYDGLNIGHDLKADVKILHAEVRAWARDVLSLEKKFG